MKKILFAILALTVMASCRQSITDNSEVAEGLVLDVSSNTVMMVVRNEDAADTLVFTYPDVEDMGSFDNCMVNDYVRLSFSNDFHIPGLLSGLEVISHYVTGTVKEADADCLKLFSDDEGPVLLYVPESADTSFFSCVSVGDDVFADCKPNDLFSEEDAHDYEVVSIKVL